MLDRLPAPAGSPAYALLMLAGLALGAFFWIRQSRHDSRVALIYLAAIGGAFAGAKIAYLLSEGWLHLEAEERWLHWLTGKSVTGALLGGWAAVEGAKKVLGYTRTTGDRYALVVPLGLILGRLGCLAHGCCQGVPCDLGPLSRTSPDGTATWPAVPVEILFNLIAFLMVLQLRRGRVLTGQHFHLYLVAYGLFRFGHEFLRDTPKPFGGVSGYQVLALVLAGAGLLAFRRRARSHFPAEISPNSSEDITGLSRRKDDCPAAVKTPE
ncbi:MAG: diacylglyceryl transferase [Akkermansiaceae bacterium]|nr:diacylglyceryl transferase [Akkermansiaceae bacterium]NNM30799.1 diacylglyceryl transferase [Akkermansiaceae bacterium]